MMPSSASRTSSAARTTSPTPACRCSCSKRWQSDPPAFGHHSLLIGADGQALSKRLGALSIESLRESGPRAVGARQLHGADRHLRRHRAAARASTSLPSSSRSTRSPPAPARFDPEELKALNAKLLHATPYDQRRRAPRAARHRRRRRRSGRPCAAISRARRCRRLVAHRQRRRRSRHRGSRADRQGRRAASRRAVGRHDLGRVDRGARRRPAGARGGRCFIRCAWR